MWQIFEPLAYSNEKWQLICSVEVGAFLLEYVKWKLATDLFLHDTYYYQEQEYQSLDRDGYDCVLDVWLLDPYSPTDSE